MKLIGKNQYETLDSRELIFLYERYLSEGFIYLPFNRLFDNGPFVITPSGKELTQRRIQQILDDKLVFGDELQLEALAAAEFIKINYSMDSIDKSSIIFPVSSP